mmetsp:Transcript_16768/g.34365  ORF Transcript_16768/g.34365 Transcript_16768/m.34365 type:complete len:310 (+) Transcript_16768:326-1255(+)
MPVRDEVRGHNVLVLVSKNALHLTLRRLLDGRTDSLIRSTLVQTCRQVNNRHIRSGDTERHSCQLAIQLRNHLPNSLSSSCGRGNDVVACSPASPPVLLRGTIHSLLGRSDSMDSGHQTLLQTKLIIDDLGKGSKAVGGAGRVGHHIHGALILLLVDSHDKHGGITRGSRDDNLLCSSLHVHGSLLSGGENTGGFNDVISTRAAPLDLGGVHFAKDLDILAINGQGIITSLLNCTGVLPVDSVVLEHVLHVVDRDERVIDRDNVDHGVVLCSAHDQTTNATEAIDTNVDRLERSLTTLAVDNVSKLRLE